MNHDVPELVKVASDMLEYAKWLRMQDISWLEYFRDAMSDEEYKFWHDEILRGVIR